MGKNVQIIPPSRSSVPATRSGSKPATDVRIARVNPGGVISSTLMRWEAIRHERTFGALAGRTRAEADYFDAQSEAVDAYIRRGRAVCRLQELPEMLATDRARRRAERAEELRELGHQHLLAAKRRETERADVNRLLVDAQQELRAQREFGYTTHELAWKKKNCELLGVELDAAERRALLEEARNPKVKTPKALSEAELIERLYAKREELRADGLDTSRIDAALARVDKS
jgi:hypothetical protein